MRGLAVLLAVLALSGCVFVKAPEKPAPTLADPPTVSNVAAKGDKLPLPKPRPKKHKAAKPIDCDTVRWAAVNLSREFIKSKEPNYTAAQKAEAARCLRG